VFIAVAPWRGRGAARRPWRGGARGGSGAAGVLLEEGEGGGDSTWWAGSATGPIGPKVEEDFFSNKNGIFEFTKALEICRRRFRRNFEVGIFS
jgi:hypothetical protein